MAGAREGVWGRGQWQWEETRVQSCTQWGRIHYTWCEEAGMRSEPSPICCSGGVHGCKTELPNKSDENPRNVQWLLQFSFPPIDGAGNSSLLLHKW